MLKAFRVLGTIIIISLLLITSIACEAEYRLDVTVASGQGVVTPSSDTYAEGTLVTIAAIPDSGWEFDRWEGDWGGTNNPLTITMNSQKTIEAIFIEIPTPTPTPTPTPILITPLAGEHDVILTPLLYWSNAVEATGFELMLAANCDWSNPVISLIGSAALGLNTTYQVPQSQTLQEGTNYCWKVRAVNAGTATSSPWSDTGTFTTLIISDTETYGNGNP